MLTPLARCQARRQVETLALSLSEELAGAREQVFAKEAHIKTLEAAARNAEATAKANLREAASQHARELAAERRHRAEVEGRAAALQAQARAAGAGSRRIGMS